jgi:hypothetical protein
VRAPDTYLLSARFAMMPSRPLRSASSKNFVPDVSRWRLNATSLCLGRMALRRFLRSVSGNSSKPTPSRNIKSNARPSNSPPLFPATYLNKPFGDNARMGTVRRTPVERRPRERKPGPSETKNFRFADKRKT